MNREIESIEQFQAQRSTGSLRGYYVQGIDLTQVTGDWSDVDVVDAVFLGCAMSDATADSLRHAGADVFPVLPDVPVDAYRSMLYSPQELYGDSTYADSLDKRAYDWAENNSPSDVGFSLATALHDHAIHDALLDYVADTASSRIVGVMGGHALARNVEGYRAAARLGQLLTLDGILVATGGGPGAMEAANLGAYLAHHDLDAALDLLAVTPSFRPSIDAWADAAFRVRGEVTGGADSLGIPTWHYGHEPPNAFANHIAKYFSNAIREDILLSLCRGGLIYLEGAAGTVQEIFQAVTSSYYAANEQDCTPLVLVGLTQWSESVPVWPLLQQLAHGRPMETSIALVDNVDDAHQWLRDYWSPTPSQH